MNSQNSFVPNPIVVERMFGAVVSLLDQQIDDFSALQNMCSAFRDQVDRMLRPRNAAADDSAAQNASEATGQESELPESSVPDDSLRDRLSADFRDLLHRIQQQQDSLQTRLGQLERELGQVMLPPLNLTRFMQLLQTEQQTQIRARRAALLDKLLAVRSIMVGSHLVLGYRLEFYQQLISAISGHTSTSTCYSATGGSVPSDAGILIERDC